MPETLIFIGIAAICLVIGSLFGIYIGKLQLKTSIKELETKLTSQELLQKNTELQIENIKAENKENLLQAEQEKEKIRSEKEQLLTQLAIKEAEYKNILEKNEAQYAEIEKLQEKFNTEFENLANNILEKKSEKFTLQNKENIESILKPLHEKIKVFEEKVEKNNHNAIRQHAELGKQLEFLNQQNIKISQEATNLTKALKGNSKMQGNWGEMVLERVLERSGLQKDTEYFVQQNFTTTTGKRLMPDVIIKMPAKKVMIIDAKVSLNAYERYVNEENPEEKASHLKNHLFAIKKHVEELSKKSYHQLYDTESPDFVLLFIPIEAAFAVASNQHPQLYNDAFEKNIILVTPTTLLAVLKTIDSMWQNEKQKQNAINIAQQAGSLYDSFTNLTNELLKIGKQLGTVQNTYDTAMKKLTGRGNLIKRVQELKKLGAKASKELDEKLLKQAEEDI